MSAQPRILDPSRSHDDFALEFVRMFLGVALFIRGVLFIGDSSKILQLAEAAGIDRFLPTLVLYVVIPAHLIGGLLLALGLLSQFAALIQIPVLIGAVVVSFVQGGPFMPDQSFELSVMVLLLLGILFRMGSGRFSLDYLLFVRGKSAEEERMERLRLLTVELKRQVQRADQLREDELQDLQEQILKHEQTLDHDISGIASKVALIGKYVVVVSGSCVILILALQALPFDVSPTEIAVTSALLFAIVGFFFFFFSWALREE